MSRARSSGGDRRAGCASVTAWPGWVVMVMSPLLLLAVIALPAVGDCGTDTVVTPNGFRVATR